MQLNTTASDKVVVRFRHTGSAPVLKQSKFKLPASMRFHSISTQLRKHLQLDPSEPLVCSLSP